LTVPSKGQRRSVLTVPIFLNKWTTRAFITTSIFRSKKKLYSLCKYPTGSLSVSPFILGVIPGHYNFMSNLSQKYWRNNTPGNFVLLRFVSLHSIISNIFVRDVRKYATSNGTFCQVLDLFFEFNLIKLCLPSKNIKIVSGWCFVILGRNSQLDHKYNVFGKAGYRLFSGKKPKSRGVARNPVDHPHGGRTKTNKPEVSIWGWIAKRNK